MLFFCFDSFTLDVLYFKYIITFVNVKSMFTIDVYIICCRELLLLLIASHLCLFIYHLMGGKFNSSTGYHFLRRDCIINTHHSIIHHSHHRDKVRRQHHIHHCNNTLRTQNNTDCLILGVGAGVSLYQIPMSTAKTLS